MSETTRFEIGCEARCADGSSCGTLSRVVVDPIRKCLTHVVIEPRHGVAIGRLVPVELVTAADHGVQLACSEEELTQLPEAEETRFLPGDDSGLPPEQVLSWPYFGLGGAGVGWMGMGGLGMGGTDLGPTALTYDKVPTGEVEVRRGEHVHAADGTIGKVRGLVVDAEHNVTHLLLEEGHLWGHKRVAIPIGAVASVEDGVHLSLSKEQVRQLPPVDLAGDEPAS